MKKNTVSVLILASGMALLWSTLSLTGCYYLRPTGPCLGVGCPARTVGQNGQYKKNEGPKAQNVGGKDNGPKTAQSQPKAGK